MELWLIRHGIAVPGNATLPDAARPLTPLGQQRIRQIATALQRLGIGFARLYHSPWLRAVETAELLHPVLDGEMLVTSLLARPPEKALLEALPDAPTALVGHQPWMSELLAWLVYGSPQAAAAIAFKKGGVAWLEGKPRPGRMVLRAFLPPKMLCLLGQEK